MWLRVVVAACLTTQVWTQLAHASQTVQHNGASYEWGWQLTPVDVGTPVPVDQYYVQLSQPVQHIQYTTNVGVLQNAEPLVDGNGEPATVNFNSATPVQIYRNPTLFNNTQILNGEFAQGHSERAPADIFLLQQQLSLPQLQTLQSDFSGDHITHANIQQDYTNRQNTAPAQIGYNIQAQHPQVNNIQTNEALGIGRANDVLNSKHAQKISTELNHTSIVQVFKDHNCSNDDALDMHETPIPIYSEYNVNENYGAKNLQKKPISYKGATDFKIERTRDNTNNEGYYYYSTETPRDATRTTDYNEENGILRLVASTQDLISNDDLLKINHSVEKHLSEVDDDYIKPRPRYNLRTEETRYNQRPRNHITVKAKIRNIENRAVEHTGNNVANDEIRQSIYQSDKFISPIVVPESSNVDFSEGVVNTLVSTMSPYIDNGYEIVSITKKSKQNYTNYVPQYFNQDTVYITPRPVGQKYLAPITVALRLLNANNTEVLNSIEDHDPSETELIEDTVKSPSKERTVVEIQESIPLDITHINEVEVHEYLDEGRSNSEPFDVARTLYNTYMEVLQATKKNERNTNEFLNKHDTVAGNANANEDSHDSQEKLEPSENIQSEVQVKLNGEEFNNKEYKNENDYNNRYFNQNVIQPIVIEKEVPITQYVNRYIERQAPYPKPAEVRRMPVDRPVPGPVPYEREVEKPGEVTKHIDKPYPYQVPQPYPLIVPFPVEQKVYVDRPVHLPYRVEKLVEKQFVQTVPVPTPVAVPVKVHVSVEKSIPYPVPVEKPILVPVEKPVPVDKIVEKQVKVPVPIPVHIVKHYPVDRIVEKQVPYLFPVDRVVEKRVPVNVPYPVEKVIEKFVEKPVVITKYVDKPYPVETKVPYIFEKIVEKKVPYAVRVPYIPGELSSQTYANFGQESQNHPQYLLYQDQSKQIVSPNSVQSKQKDHHHPTKKQENHNQYSNGRQQKQIGPVLKSQWGHLYASSYNHLKVSPHDNKDVMKAPLYITYLTNQNYYGPPPTQADDSLWERNNEFLSEAKFQRNDRTPKLSNLRIEYGGFKPPLIPSTEVDLDGRPIDKGSET